MILQIHLDNSFIALGIAFISTIAVYLAVPKYLPNFRVVVLIGFIRFLLILAILELQTSPQSEHFLIELSLLLGIISLSSVDILILVANTHRYPLGQIQVSSGSKEYTKENTAKQQAKDKTTDDQEDVEEALELLRNISVDDLEWLVDFGETKQTLGMQVAMAHVLQRVSKSVPDHQTWLDIKAQHNEGISKEYISTCKHILKDNGFMKAESFGTKEKIVWEDPEVIALTVISKQIGDMDD